MIHYALRCDKGDKFDGWFDSSDRFEKEAKAGGLECPCCGSPKVERDIMGPHVVTGAKKKPPPSKELVEAMMAQARKARRFVEENGENFGRHFASEVLRRREKGTPTDLVYGDPTHDEVIRLKEMNVKGLAAVPWPDLEPATPEKSGRGGARKARKPGSGVN